MRGDFYLRKKNEIKHEVSKFLFFFHAFCAFYKRQGDLSSCGNTLYVYEKGMKYVALLWKTLYRSL